MAQIILPKDFDATRMSYNAPKQLDSGGRAIYINYNGGPLMLQTPDMTAPFGVSVWNNERTGLPEKYNIDVSFQGRDSRESVQRFYDAIHAMDEKLVTDAMENSMAWFKKRFPSRAVVEALFTPMIKHAKDRETGEVTDKYPPTFKMTLPFRDGAFQVDGVYDDRRRDLDLMEVINREGRGKGSRVRAIIQCSGIWVAGGKFGCTWKVKQLIMVPPAMLKPFAFLPDDSAQLVDDDEGGDEGDEAESLRPSRRAGTAKAARTNIVESSDEEDAAGEERPPRASVAALADEEDDLEPRAA